MITTAERLYNQRQTNGEKDKTEIFKKDAESYLRKSQGDRKERQGNML